MPSLGRAVPILITAGLILACNFGSVPAIQTTGVPTAVALTHEASATPAPTAHATPGTRVSYANISFVVPAGVASGATSSTIPAADEQNGGPWAAAPAHAEFAFSDYGLAPGFFTPVQIDVYPAQAYANANTGASISLQSLRTLLSNPSSPLNNTTLPQVPYFNAGPMFEAQAKVIRFQNGSGVRMITQYGQAPGPAANNGTFFHFQGLTDDGNYYVIAVLAIEAPFLQNGNDPSATLPADGIPFPGYNYADANYYDAYYKAVTDKLGATPPDAFHPALSDLDGLIESLEVSP